MCKERDKGSENENEQEIYSRFAAATWCVYMYINIHFKTWYMCIYIEKERERERESYSHFVAATWFVCCVYVGWFRLVGSIKW